ncbi:MAG: hypothetical protein ACREM3_15215 [Candidatus Rokuibacteriota bacterium]
MNVLDAAEWFRRFGPSRSGPIHVLISSEPRHTATLSVEYLSSVGDITRALARFAVDASWPIDTYLLGTRAAGGMVWCRVHIDRTRLARVVDVDRADDDGVLELATVAAAAMVSTDAAAALGRALAGDGSPLMGLLERAAAKVQRAKDVRDVVAKLYEQSVETPLSPLEALQCMGDLVVDDDPTAANVLAGTATFVRRFVENRSDQLDRELVAAGAPAALRDEARRELCRFAGDAVRRLYDEASKPRLRHASAAELVAALPSVAARAGRALERRYTRRPASPPAASWMRRQNGMNPHRPAVDLPEAHGARAPDGGDDEPPPALPPSSLRRDSPEGRRLIDDILEQFRTWCAEHGIPW